MSSASFAPAPPCRVLLLCCTLPLPPHQCRPAAAALSHPPVLLPLSQRPPPQLKPSLPTLCAVMAVTAEADALLPSTREPSPHDGAPPPGSVPARPDLNLNEPAEDGEGHGGDAGCSRSGGESADGSAAPSAHDGAAATPLPERVVGAGRVLRSIDLNQRAGDDEGGGGAADRSRRGGKSAAQGRAHGDAATTPLPERLAEGTCGAAKEESYAFLKSLWDNRMPMAGLGFHPTEQELLDHLRAKLMDDGINSHPLIGEFITTIQDEDGICHTHPENLPGVTKDGSAKYFFHRTSNAYTTGKRKRRQIQGELTWHQTGKGCPVTVDGRVMGYKKFMVLYNWRQHRRESDKWVMHQFHIGERWDEEGELVVSKIFCHPAKEKEKARSSARRSTRETMVRY
ncbi:uncharacterized protein [Triticum aestivum]|uniref:uncharacterized protein n=1 Tax=Triticum aestivum TaxID=4565 RepID=UPI000842AF28|nr:uncharacterized protein LOC123113640 [Triticum aestivum]